MEGKVTFRKMVQNDVPQVAQLYSVMYKEQKQMGMVMDFNHSEVADIVSSQLKSKFFISIVAESESSILGFAIGSIGRMPKKYVYKDELLFGYIQDLYVDTPHRKSGVGPILLEKLEVIFREEEIHYIELDVLTGNEIGMKFWKNNGYTDVIHKMYKTL